VGGRGRAVSRLIRTHYGNVTLGPHLFTGNWRPLTEEEIAGLRELAGMPKPQAQARRIGGPRDRRRVAHDARPMTNAPIVHRPGTVGIVRCGLQR
jgi:23S rRNA pseudouridine2605 synthase